MEKDTAVMQTGKNELETMVSLMQKLEKEGFITQFKVGEKGLESLATGRIYQPTDVKIESFFRFEGESDPEDNSVLYAISTNDGEKGTLSDGYGNSSEPRVGEFLRKVEEITKSF